MLILGQTAEHAAPRAQITTGERETDRKANSAVESTSNLQAHH